ncbi:MAG: adenylosuccinate lyase [Patescibacteria group bacterium]
MLNPLTAISPLDGRYRDKVTALADYFSEYALMRTRVRVEIEWFIFLCNVLKLSGTRKLSTEEVRVLNAIYLEFDVTDAERVKDFEKTTNHDVKAIEYFIKEHLNAYPQIATMGEFIHFACTSEDINNLSYGIILNEFMTTLFTPMVTGISAEMEFIAKKYKSVPMLARTHGQPATPTTVGKEFAVFMTRIKSQLAILGRLPAPFGKINGASGNFNAHIVAYPKTDWIGASKKFVESLGLTWNAHTTQIEPHDHLAEIFHSCIRINTILIDASRDIWNYISIGYFKQKTKAGEVGSSTMPHKVNPIDFENAEGNLGLANALFDHMALKLPISRMQRDLTDSTVQRNIGSAFAYSVLAYKSLLKGFSKLGLNHAALEKDLDENWEVLAEPVQTVLRRYKVAGAYELLKELTRGKRVDKKTFQSFIRKLKIPAGDKKRLLALTPATYTGLASRLVDLSS